MGQGHEHSELLATIERALCPEEDVEFAVAFGSRTTGRAHASSDLDIAVKFVDELSAGERFRRRCFLAGDLQQSGAPRVDVVDVEALPIEVAHDAVTGELLCGDETAFRRFAADVEARFSEQRDALRRRQRNVIDRIAEEGLRGGPAGRRDETRTDRTVPR